jgi:hypothetical protein
MRLDSGSKLSSKGVGAAGRSAGRSAEPEPMFNAASWENRQFLPKWQPVGDAKKKQGGGRPAGVRPPRLGTRALIFCVWILRRRHQEGHRSVFRGPCVSKLFFHCVGHQLTTAIANVGVCACCALDQHKCV